MTPALLIGREPGQELGYCYVTEPPYEAVVIGSLSLGQLLRFGRSGCWKLWRKASRCCCIPPDCPGTPQPGAGRGALPLPGRELKNWGVLFTDGGRKQACHRRGSQTAAAAGERPGFDAVLTPWQRKFWRETIENR